MGTSKTKIALFLFTFLFFFTNSIAPALATTHYTYDANGNMTSDGTNCFTYNDANQLSQVKNCSTNQVTAAYVYDYQGNRIVKKVYTSGSLTKTVYSPDKSFETVKLASNGATLNTSYYYVNDELIARKNPDASKNYYHSDNLHSTSVLTDQSGTVVETTAYYPFGDIRSGGTQSKQLYTGQENDPETGLDYYNARYYNSHIHRFTQPDTQIADIYNPQNLNRYSYVNNNPLTYTDPSGHFAFMIPLITGGIGSLAAVGMLYMSNPHFQKSQLPDYGKALVVGFAAGFAAPLITAAVAGTAADTIASSSILSTIIPASLQPVVANSIGVGVSSASVNIVNNYVNKQDPRKDLIPMIGRDIVIDYLTSGIVPMQGRTPSLINPTQLGTNSLKQIGREGLSDIMSNLFENMFNNPMGSMNYSQKYNYNKSNATYFEQKR
jgi:RHS repeat-associated protein